MAQTLKKLKPVLKIETPKKYGRFHSVKDLKSNFKIQGSADLYSAVVENMILD